MRRGSHVAADDCLERLSAATGDALLTIDGNTISIVAPLVKA